MLREVAEAGVRVALALAGSRGELAGENAQQRGLPGSVRTDDRHLVLSVDLDIRVAEHIGAALVRERRVPKPNERAPGVRRIREVEADVLRRDAE